MTNDWATTTARRVVNTWEATRPANETNGLALVEVVAAALRLEQAKADAANDERIAALREERDMLELERDALLEGLGLDPSGSYSIDQMRNEGLGLRKAERERCAQAIEARAAVVDHTATRLALNDAVTIVRTLK